MKKKLFLGLLLLALLLSGCQKEAQGVKEAVFQGEVQTLEVMEPPEALPTELCGDYNAWDRAAAWSEMAESEDASARLYANREDYASMYLLWNDSFYVLPWADEREMEQNVNLSLEDLDGDGRQEVVAIALVNGGTGWSRGQVYIIEQEGRQVKFPLKALENWLQDNLALTDYVLTFFDLSVPVTNVYDLSRPVVLEGITEDTELAESPAIIAFTAENGLSVEIIINAANTALPPLGILSGDLIYQNGLFSIQSLSLTAWQE